MHAVPRPATAMVLVLAMTTCLPLPSDVRSGEGGGSCSSLSSCVGLLPGVEAERQHPIGLPSSRSRLGARASLTGTVITVDDDASFIVSPLDSLAMDAATIELHADGDLHLRASYLVASSGVEASAEAAAVIRVRGLHVRRGVGIPDPSSAPEDGEPVVCDVVTSEVWAEKVTVDLHGGKAASAGFLKAVGAAASVSVGVTLAAGWRQTSSTRLEGTNIVLTVGTKRVSSSIRTSDFELGSELSAGMVVALPRGVDAGLVVRGFDGPSRTLTVRVSGAVDVDSLTALHLPPCTVGNDLSLASGDRCYVMSHRGDAAVGVWWSSHPGGFLLHLREYRTTIVR